MDFDEMLHRHVTEGEPPLGLNQDTVMRKARGQQRARIAAVAAGVGAVTLIGTLSLAAPGAPPGPSFGDEPSTCAMLPPGKVPTVHPSNAATGTPERLDVLSPMELPLALPATPAKPDPTRYPTTDDPTQYPTQDPIADPTRYPTDEPTQHPTADPASTPLNTFLGDASDQITCFLRAAVSRYSPAAVEWPFDEPGEAGLLLHDNPNTAAGGFVASAKLIDAAGLGAFKIYVGLPKNAVQPRTACAPQPCTTQVGPHGEHIESYTTIDGGRVGYAVYVWSGEKLIILTTDNNGQHLPPFRPSPFFTMNQLIEIGCDPIMTTM